MENIEINKALEAPPFLQGTALDTYRELAAQLHQLGFLETTDRDCLAVYCELWSSWLMEMEKEDADIDMLLKIEETLLQYSDALGLNPRARIEIQRKL